MKILMSICIFNKQVSGKFVVWKFNKLDLKIEYFP